MQQSRTSDTGTVEAVLSARPEIAEAITLGNPASTGEAMVVVVPTGFLAGIEVHRILLDELGKAAAALAIAVVPEIWRRTDGAVDDVRVGEYLSRSASVYRYEPPADEVERQLAAIWQRVLDLPDVGRYDDFIEAGGDSAAAVELMAAIEDTFGVDVSIEDLFEAGSVHGVARKIRQAVSIDAAPAGTAGT